MFTSDEVFLRYQRSQLGSGDVPQPAQDTMKKHLLQICVALSPMLCAHATHAIESPEDRWNLADLYPTIAAWNADVAKLTAQLKEFDVCRGHLGDSAARLKTCLDLNADEAARHRTRRSQIVNHALND